MLLQATKEVMLLQCLEVYSHSAVCLTTCYLPLSCICFDVIEVLTCLRFGAPSVLPGC